MLMKALASPRPGPLCNHSLCPRQKLIRRKGRSKTQLGLNPKTSLRESGETKDDFSELESMPDDEFMDFTEDASIAESEEETGNIHASAEQPS
ncbi:hypothetical protein Tco_0818541 [Tanacetum coccineum]